MPVFAYRARTPAGRVERGIVDAESLRGAWQQLRARDVFPTELRTSDGAAPRRRADPLELAAATRQLASLVGAGVPVADALDDVAAESHDPALRHGLTVARARLREGAALADALAASPAVFPALTCELVRAGEESGALAAVLERLARDGRTRVERRARLRTALVYPAAMLATTTFVLAFLLVAVVPEVTRLFAETGAPLPLATRLLVAAAAGLRTGWWLLAGVAVLAVLGFRRAAATPDGRRAHDHQALRLPVAGGVVRRFATGRVARTLATVLPNGLALDRGLALAAATAGNVVVADAVEALRDALREGESLAPALARHALFPPTLCRLVATGERTGALAEAFERAAAVEEAEAERALAALTALVEPALVVVMGAAVLVLVLASLVQALDLYRLDNGVYPTTEQGLDALVERPTLTPTPKAWRSEGYVDRVPLDSWGNPYAYVLATPQRFALKSLGSDGVEGGEGLAADIDARGR